MCKNINAGEQKEENRNFPQDEKKTELKDLPRGRLEIRNGTDQSLRTFSFLHISPFFIVCTTMYIDLCHYILPVLYKAIRQFMHR